jgi:hypothetical protein
MLCRDCLHYLDSVKSNAPRWGLDDYGYCKAAPSLELRARIFHEKTKCWIDPQRFQERKS